MKIYLLTFACVSLVIGCSAPRSGRVTVVPRPYLEAANGRPDQVRFPEVVKAYHVGRSIDPNPAVLHEAHAIYRVEAQSTWNLQPPAGYFLLPSSVGVLTNAAYVAPAVNEAVIAELNHQRTITRTVSQQAASLGNSLQELGTALAASRSLIEQNRALRLQLSRIENRLEAAEAKLRAAPTPP